MTNQQLMYEASKLINENKFDEAYNFLCKETAVKVDADINILLLISKLSIILNYTDEIPSHLIQLISKRESKVLSPDEEKKFQEVMDDYEQNYIDKQAEAEEIDWIEKAKISYANSDFSSAKTFAEQAYKEDDSDIETCFIYLKTLIVKNTNESLNQLEKNLHLATNLLTFIRNSDLDPKQSESFKNLSLEKYDFHAFVDNIRFKIEENF